MMQVVFVVLHKTELLQDLLTKLKKAGVSGGTIIDSQGMISYIQESDECYDFLNHLKLYQCFSLLKTNKLILFLKPLIKL